jgi:hypothetical protein
VDNTIEIVYSEIGKKRKQQEVPWTGMEEAECSVISWIKA